MGRAWPVSTLGGSLVWGGALALFCALGVTFAVGCGGYAATVRNMNGAIARGDLEKAVDAVNAELDVDSSGQAPAELDSQSTLLLLERATLQQALERYEPSASDFKLADDSLEVFSLTSDAAGDIGKFLFSDDSGIYVGAPFEKLMVNTLNMLNYLAMGRLEPARVEARRLQTIRELLQEEEGDDSAALGLPSYLAGLTFEASGRAAEALHYYADALEVATFESLREPVRRLAAEAPFRATALEPFLAEGEAIGAPPAGYGTVVVVAAVGRVPHREAERIPIGLALTLVASSQGRHAVTAEQRQQADLLAARGLLTWIAMPRLAPTPRRFDFAAVSVDGLDVSTDLAVDLEQISLAWYEEIKPTLVAAALTRSLTRLLAGLAVQEATKAAGGKNGWAALLGLAVQGALTAADTPDTRSWNTLAARYFVARADVPPGTHEIRISWSGPGGHARADRRVDVREGATLVFPIWAIQ